MHFRKKEIKNHFVDDTIIYVENSKRINKRTPKINKQLQQDCKKQS